MNKRKNKKIPVYFHQDQLAHKPLFEWAFGEKIPHPETTSRAESILSAINENADNYSLRAPKGIPTQLLRQIHTPHLTQIYKTAMALPQDQTFYPSVFPKRIYKNANPKDIHHTGFYCFDSGTPLNSTTWSAAAWSASCADYAARLIASGKEDLAYSLCRPPGHHAAYDLFGGYCYFNNAAVAAYRLRPLGKVVILDIDFHHGNGTQSLFYNSPDIFVISIHGDPKLYFPFVSGFSNERGANEGTGYNLNIPLPTGVDGQEYLKVLNSKVLPIIRKYKPATLVVSAGFDTYVGDPIGKFSFETPDYHEIGRTLASLNLPTLVVQEGGYSAEMLGKNVHSLLSGFIS